MTKNATGSNHRSTAVDALISKRISQKNSHPDRSTRTDRTGQNTSGVSSSDDEEEQISTTTTNHDLKCNQLNSEPDTDNSKTTEILPQDEGQNRNIGSTAASTGSDDNEVQPMAQSAGSVNNGWTQKTPASIASSSAAKTQRTASAVKTPRCRNSGWGHTPNYRRELSHRQSPIRTRSLVKRQSHLPFITVNKT